MSVEELGPLPAGRHGFTPEQVAHNQRERLIAGLATAVAERGYAAVTITHITAEAKVSRRVFYANFEGKEECFLAAFEVVAGHVHELAAEAIAPIPDWPHRAIAATRAVLAFLAAEPDLARLCLVESQGAGPAVSARFHDAVHEAVPFLELGRAERQRDRPLPDSTEESTIGALVSLASRKVAAGEAEQLEELLPDCAEFILSPYLGAEEAARLGGEIGRAQP
ncbi:MAG TPA: TetR/AcrR family transcriptional regulator [Solirubrobacterales bacterium]|nr:TetR/AcrR family transcriptional regulator [Solirubrobacterales bacterium]